MRASYSPQSGLRQGLEDWLLLSELHPIVLTIVARVLPSRFGAYRPTVARTFLSFSEAVSTLCPFIPENMLANVDTGLVRCTT